MPLSLAFVVQSALIAKSKKADNKPELSNKKTAIETVLSASAIRSLKAKDQARALSTMISLSKDPNIVHFVNNFINSSKKELRQEMVERSAVSIFNTLGREATIKFLKNRKEVAEGMKAEIKEANFLYYGIDGRIFHDMKTPQLIPSKVPRPPG